MPSAELQTHVVSVCMGCGHPTAQLLQLLRVVSVCMGCGHPAAQLLRSCCAGASDIRKRIAALKWSARRVRPRGCCAPQLGSNYQADNQADTSADTSVRTIRLIIRLIL